MRTKNICSVLYPGGGLLTLVALLIALLSFNACQKDSPALSEKSLSSIGVSPRSEGNTFTQAEWAAVLAHLDGIDSFRQQVHAWRSNPSGEGLPALEVVEKTEIAFNYYQGNPTVPFESYEDIEQRLPVSANATWTPAQVVAFYDGVKSLLQQALAGSGVRKLNVLALTNPVVTDTGTAVWVIMQVGINPMSNYVPGAVFEGLEDVRWAPATEGFTQPTSCSGAANVLIGSEVNRRLAVFQPINAGPGSGGNMPLPGRIVTRISFGEHNVLGFEFPQGTDYPREYTVATWNTLLQNLHYNSIGFGGNNPPKNCLLPSELEFFTNGNLELANDGRQRLQPDPPGPFYNRRRVVCTGVGAFWAGASTPGNPSITIRL
ncbi:MAG: hypothetical protein NZM43_12055 [Saprospiraceae bacterium]|nr:hypothetical protein [Saprospiraceae bacterium]MDW8485044.1 hypothetical protein [Saprospiraceae bacterium]